MVTSPVLEAFKPPAAVIFHFKLLTQVRYVEHVFQLHWKRIDKFFDRIYLFIHRIVWNWPAVTF